MPRKILAATGLALGLLTTPVHAADPRVAASIALLESLGSGDPAAITGTVSDDRYRQHNLAFPDGRAPLLAALPMLRQTGTTWHVVRAFVDGDTVVTHSEAHFMGADRVAIDVLRFDGDRVVEHWDNLQVKTGPNPSGHGMTDGATAVTDLDRTAANKTLVGDFVSAVLIGGRFPDMAQYLSSARYVQHNPMVADGMAGLQAAAPLLAKFRYRSLEKLLGQGNFVLAMSHVSLDGVDAAAYDLFRVEGGRIVEHWDVVQAIPPRAEWQNANGKF